MPSFPLACPPRSYQLFPTPLACPPRSHQIFPTPSTLNNEYYANRCHDRPTTILHSLFTLSPPSWPLFATSHLSSLLQVKKQYHTAGTDEQIRGETEKKARTAQPPANMKHEETAWRCQQPPHTQTTTARRSTGRNKASLSFPSAAFPPRVLLALPSSTDPSNQPTTLPATSLAAY